jgi:hypothetical protein
MSDSAAETDLEVRGFTVVRLLSEGGAQGLNDSIASLRADGLFDCSEGSKQFPFHSSFLDPDRDYRRRVHELVLDACKAPFESRFPSHWVMIGGLLLKPSGAGDVELHHDWTMVRDRRQRPLHVWCPLTPAAAVNGVLHFVEGSHRIVDHIGAPHTPVYCRGYQEALKVRSVSVKLSPGEALVYDSTILHWSPPNLGAEPRPAITLTCLPREAEPVFYRRDGEGQRFELYDMADGGFFEHEAADFFAGTIRRPSLGFVANPNRQVPAAEFERLVAAARRRRGGGTGPDQRPSAWSRIRRSLGMRAPA